MSKSRLYKHLCLVYSVIWQKSGCLGCSPDPPPPMPCFDLSRCSCVRKDESSFLAKLDRVSNTLWEPCALLQVVVVLLLWRRSLQVGFYLCLVCHHVINKMLYWACCPVTISGRLILIVQEEKTRARCCRLYINECVRILQWVTLKIIWDSQTFPHTTQV